VVFHFQYLIYLDLLGSESMNSSGFNPISQAAGENRFLKLGGKANEATSGQQHCKFRNRRSVAEQEDSHRDAGKRHGGRV
jgi:hypothetical protein